MSTYTVAVSGPSPRMAMLAALIRKIAATGQQAWTAARTLITGITEVGRGIATGALAIIGAPTGYTTATTGLRTVIRGIWRTGLGVLRWTGHQLQQAGRYLHGLISAVSPTAAGHLAHATHAVVTPVLDVAVRCGPRWRPPATCSGGSAAPTSCAWPPPGPPNWPPCSSASTP